MKYRHFQIKYYQESPSLVDLHYNKCYRNSFRLKGKEFTRKTQSFKKYINIKDVKFYGIHVNKAKIYKILQHI